MLIAFDMLTDVDILRAGCSAPAIAVPLDEIDAAFAALGENAAADFPVPSYFGMIIVGIAAAQPDLAERTREHAGA